MGRTTCSYFLPGNKQILYASTHLGVRIARQIPSRVPIMYLCGPFTPNSTYFCGRPHRQHCEATYQHTRLRCRSHCVAWRQKDCIYVNPQWRPRFIHLRYRCKKCKQVTNQLGYDGGAFFSPDKKFTFLVHRGLEHLEEIKEYKELLAQNLVMPTNMEICVCNVDGSDSQAGYPPRAKPTGPRFLRPTAKKLSFRAITNPRKDTIFTFFWWTSMELVWSRLLPKVILMLSLCFSPDGKSWYGRRTATTTVPATLIYLSPTVK